MMYMPSTIPLLSVCGIIMLSTTSANYTGSIGSSYRFYSIATDSAGNIQDDTIYSTTSILSGISTLASDEMALKQNTPNPFSAARIFIQFYVPQVSTVLLEVKDIYGRNIATLVNGQLSSGWHQQLFDANNLSAGIYFYQMTMNGRTLTKRMAVE